MLPLELSAKDETSWLVKLNCFKSNLHLQIFSEQLSKGNCFDGSLSRLPEEGLEAAECLEKGFPGITYMEISLLSRVYKLAPNLVAMSSSSSLSESSYMFLTISSMPILRKSPMEASIPQAIWQNVSPALNEQIDKNRIIPGPTLLHRQVYEGRCS